MALQILLLAAVPSGAAGTIKDHVRAFKAYSKHHVRCFPHVGVVANHLPAAIKLSQFDVLVIHYSVYLLSQDYLGAEARAEIAAFDGTKVLFVQDEYRQIDLMVSIIRELRINLLFTCVPQHEIDKVYPAARLPDVVKITNLTGYVPEGLTNRRSPGTQDRPIDVGYRARVLPYWLGRLSTDKWRIGPAFVAASRDYGLRCDVSVREEDRIYGDRWIRFLQSCKTTLGVESGASVMDFDGTIQRRVEAFVAANPQATFEEVERRFLFPYDGRIRLNQISPRCFEAAALRTGMILFEGEYSGILAAWRHYIPLRKDLSNIEEVVAAIRDQPRLQAIVDCAYEEIALNPEFSYRRFVERFDAAVSAITNPIRRSHSRKVSALRFKLATLPSAMYLHLLKCWLRIPISVRAKLKPIMSPLIAAIRR